MRILFMANVEPNPHSGASGTEVQTIAALRRAGHEVDALWAGDLPHRLRHPNLHNVFELPFGYREAMKRRLAQRCYDVVHVNQPYGFLAAKWLRQAAYPAVFVHRSHGFEGRVEAELQRWRKAYQADRRSGARRLASAAMSQLLGISQVQIAKYAHGHIVSSSQCRDFLTERHGVPAARIAVIPQAPPSIYQQNSAEPVSAQRLKRLLYVGQFAFVKGTPILASAVTELLRASPELSFTWVCAASDHQSVRALFPEDLGDRVELERWKGQDELMSVFDRHGVFLFPSFFEGFGKAFVEAMARGLVVVASDNGGMRDVIDHGVTGFLFETGNIPELVKFVRRASENPAESSRISTAARSQAAAYTWARSAEEVLGFYMDLRRRDVLAAL